MFLSTRCPRGPETVGVRAHVAGPLLLVERQDAVAATGDGRCTATTRAPNAHSTTHDEDYASVRPGV